jgi:TPR repeat protein
MYEMGWGVPRNLKEAKRWYSVAAENGSSKAQDALLRLQRQRSM